MEINKGMPQPLDCPKCKAKKGYRITQVEQIHSDSVFDEDGIYETQIDSEYRKLIRVMKAVTCNSCLTKLNFNIKI